LPDSPDTCYFLNPSEKLLAVARSKDANKFQETAIIPKTTGGFNDIFKFNLQQVISQLREIKLWLVSLTFLFIFAMLDYLVILGPEVIQDSFQIGKKCSPKTQTCTPEQLLHMQIGDSIPIGLTLLCLLPYMLGLVSSIHLSKQSDIDGDRIVFAVAPLSVSFIGFLILGSFDSPESKVRYLLGIIPAVCGLMGSIPSLLTYAMEIPIGENQKTTVAAVTIMAGQSFGILLISLLHATYPSEYVSQPGKCWLAGLCVLAAIGSLLVCKFVLLNEQEKTRNRAPGLRRLLDDADESRAWDDVELVDVEFLKSKRRKGQESVGKLWDEAEAI
jgi:hypothetical protein